MDDKLKKVITIIVMIFLFIVALYLVGFVLKVIFPLAIIGIIVYVIFRVINKNSANKY